MKSFKIRNESESIKQVHRERETLQHLLKLSLLLFVIVGNQLHSLEHSVAIHGYFFILGKVRLEYVEEGFQDNCLNMVVSILLINSV